MIDVSCPNCSKVYRVSDDKAGKKLRCRECQAVVPIAAPAGDDFDLGGYDDFGDDFGTPQERDPFADSFGPSGGSGSRPRPQGRRRPAKKQSGSNAGIIIAAVGGGIVVVAGIVVGIVFAVKAAGDKEDDKSKKSSDTNPTVVNVPGMPGENNGGAGGAYAQHKKLGDDLIKEMGELVAAMESVRDRNSARVAAGRINKVCDRFEQLTATGQTLPKLTFDENQRLKRELDSQMRGITARLQSVSIRAGRASQGEPAFVASLQRLQRVGNDMQRIGRGF